MQGVEGVEKLLLRAGGAGDDLNIVDQQYVHIAVFFAERGVLTRLNGRNQLVHKGFAGYVIDAHVGVGLQHIVADGVHQVRFAQPHAAVDEQRVVRLGRSFGHSQAGCVRKAVAVAHHKGIKGVLGVQKRRKGLHIRRGALVGFALGRGKQLYMQRPGGGLRQGSLKQGAVALADKIMVEIRRGLQYAGIAAQLNRRKRAFDKGIVAHLGNLVAQDITGVVPKLRNFQRKGPHLYIINAYCNPAQRGEMSKKNSPIRPALGQAVDNFRWINHRPV